MLDEADESLFFCALRVCLGTTNESLSTLYICAILERSTHFSLVINTKLVNNPAPFSFWFAADVEPRQCAAYTDAGNKGIIISFSSNTVLLRETHLAAADQLGMNQLIKCNFSILLYIANDLAVLRFCCMLSFDVVYS